MCKLMEEAPKILVVDDSKLNIRILKELLEDQYRLAVAYSGEEALDMAVVFQPDLILLDIVMPGMDGYELCGKLKQHPVTADTPVIFITALNRPEDEAKGLEFGAIDYISKPFNPAVVKARVKNHIELKRHRDFLKRISSIDGLTGLANRRRFDEYFEKELLRAVRNKQPISLMMLDVDHFKAYNDHYGHLAGDECLKAIAGALTRCLHRPGDLIARYGGEEFVCLLPETGALGAGHLAETMREAVWKLNMLHEYATNDRRVTISIGVLTLVPSSAVRLEELIWNADEMLYEAKRAGRNCWRQRVLVMES
ncbi:diguanylate cyclase [Paenibacillus thermoaerophilus]|nr:diguanylate cyclase [Paenibacillus thermoaerophilus]